MSPVYPRFETQFACDHTCVVTGELGFSLWCVYSVAYSMVLGW